MRMSPRFATLLQTPRTCSTGRSLPKFNQALGTSSTSRPEYPDWSDLIEQIKNGVVIGYDFRHHQATAGCGSYGPSRSARIFGAAGHFTPGWLPARRKAATTGSLPTLQPTHERNDSAGTIRALAAGQGGPRSRNGSSRAKHLARQETLAIVVATHRTWRRRRFSPLPMPFQVGLKR